MPVRVVARRRLRVAQPFADASNARPEKKEGKRRKVDFPSVKEKKPMHVKKEKQEQTTDATVKHEQRQPERGELEDGNATNNETGEIQDGNGELWLLGYHSIELSPYVVIFIDGYQHMLQKPSTITSWFIRRNVWAST